MSAEPDIASLAILSTEPTRAAMLVHLLDGRSWTATELARIARVRPSTASAHLRRLVEAELIAVSPRGRHRYFRIADAEIAQFLERLARLAPVRRPDTPGAIRASRQLRHCRMCYDHLAGRLGVALTDGMIQKGWVLEEEPWYRVTASGRDALAPLGIDEVSGRTCMDWSERRLHLAGALGKQLALTLLAKGWLRRDPKSRAVWVTPDGTEGFSGLFGMKLPVAGL